jgi:hypothetical protein
MSDQKMTFHVESRRIDAHASVSRCKNAKIALDTDLAGNPDAFNPVDRGPLTLNVTSGDSRFL